MRKTVVIIAGVVACLGIAGLIAFWFGSPYVLYSMFENAKIRVSFTEPGTAPTAWDRRMKTLAKKLGEWREEIAKANPDPYARDEGIFSLSSEISWSSAPVSLPQLRFVTEFVDGLVKDQAKELQKAVADFSFSEQTITDLRSMKCLLNERYNGMEMKENGRLLAHAAARAFVQGNVELGRMLADATLVMGLVAQRGWEGSTLVLFSSFADAPIRSGLTIMAQAVFSGFLAPAQQEEITKRILALLRFRGGA